MTGERTLLEGVEGKNGRRKGRRKVSGLTHASSERKPTVAFYDTNRISSKKMKKSSETETCAQDRSNSKS